KLPRAGWEPIAEDDRHYYSGWGVPRRVPAGRALAHNHILHTVGMRNGTNGFRCFTWPKGKVPSEVKLWKCGWSGLPHVSAVPEQRCIIRQQLWRTRDV